MGYLHIQDKNLYHTNHIIPIYLQTKDQSSYKKVEKDGFKVVRRKDILSILSKAEFQEVREVSDILNDYTLHLEKIENAVNSFEHKAMNTWGRSAWIGFFLVIQEYFTEAKWKYISNPSGGFMGLWCFSHQLNGMRIYLQIEQEKICFKVAVQKDINRNIIRTKLLKLFKEESKHFNLDISKPIKFGSGAYMTFAVLTNGFKSVKNDDDIIDIEQCLTLLKTLEKYIEHCVSKLESN